LTVELSETKYRNINIQDNEDTIALLYSQNLY